MKTNNRLKKITGVAIFTLFLAACSIPDLVKKQDGRTMPDSFNTVIQDTLNSAKVNWRSFFSDSNLIALIDTALMNNQELNITLQEIAVAKNEIRARKGEYLPFVDIGAGAGVEKTSRYTRNGAVEDQLEVAPGREFPEPLPDYMIGANFSWEIDIWKKLRNAKKSAIYRYLSTMEGKNFMVTKLVAEIAHSYYELMALDNQLEILKQNIEIQQNALKIVRLEKIAGEVTELAVLRFQAEVLKNQSRQYYIQQRIIETENRINYLVGRYPQHIPRNISVFSELVPDTIYAGLPAQMLVNRPDIKQAELDLAAAKLDIKVAKANFYPRLRLTAGVGYQAFNPQYLIVSPKAMLASMAGELMAPLINRNAIKATYLSANNKQIQAAYNYERRILNAYIEVVNQLSNIRNLESSYSLKAQQVDVLTRSINISTSLFKSARADYMDVLLTQRDALESRIELIEIKMQQLNAIVNVYRSLGGGWN